MRQTLLLIIRHVWPTITTVFRDDEGYLLNDWYPLSFITSPAVNAGVVRQRERGAEQIIFDCMLERIRRILLVAANHHHRALVLGAFGCGVFRNEPVDVAKYFHRWLEHSEFEGAFDHVVFAIYEKEGGENYCAFVDEFLNNGPQESSRAQREQPKYEKAQCNFNKEQGKDQTTLPSEKKDQHHRQRRQPRNRASGTPKQKQQQKHKSNG